MADEPATASSNPEPAAKPAVEPTPNPLETTTAKDGDLPINVSVPTTTPEPATPPVTSGTTGSDSPTIAPEAPITVTAAEVAPPTTSNTDSITAEIESLSGEIQALEAKIDRLTGSVKPVAESSPTPVPSSGSTEVSPVTPPVSAPAPMASKAEPKTVAVNDIYSKVAERQQEAQKAEAPKPPTDTDEAEEVGGGFSIGLIGEVLLVFGLIIFVAVAASPFYKSALSESISEAIGSIGWPTAVVSLAIGFLLSLFSKGKALTKILGLVLLLIAIVIYMAVAGYENYLGPIGPLLDSVTSFYK